MLFDSGADEQRILLFSTQGKLETANDWFADGTFKFVSALFFQLFTVHELINMISMYLCTVAKQNA